VAFVRMLGQSCDVVAGVSNGSDAIDAVARLTPDVLVVDLMMSDLDGLSVCRRVKEQTSHTDVVIVTAFDDTHVHSVALLEGASAFVPKHSAAEALEPTIRRIFSERHVIPPPPVPRDVEPRY
jgi:DNA-binding NarL/FixJ family response regulator